MPALSNSLEAATAAVGDFDFNIGFGSLALEKNENSFCCPLTCFFEEPRLLIIVVRLAFKACGTKQYYDAKYCAVSKRRTTEVNLGLSVAVPDLRMDTLAIDANHDANK